jgi:dipeptidyl aminopeptidase/acylaminoacyl peptidase
MPDPRIVPHGSWPSPVTAQDVGRATRSHEALTAADGRLYWIEERPEEGGRAVLVGWRDGARADVLPPWTDVRSRVNEYGGGAYAVHRGTVFFSDAGDHRVHRWDPGAPLRPLTPHPRQPGSLRYADLCPLPSGCGLVAVRERHGPDGIRQDLVAIGADGEGEPRVLFAGADFCSSPRPSPDGRHLAWTTWDHPAMPWDATTLWLADVAADGGLLDPRPVAGGLGESIVQPSWSPDGALHLISDRSGWWNLHRWRDGRLDPLAPGPAEFAEPPWEFGYASYAFFPDGRIACVYRVEGVPRLGVLATGHGTVREVALPFRSFKPFVAVLGDRVAVLAATPSTTPAVALVDVDRGTVELLTEPDVLGPGLVSDPRPVRVTAADGAGVHGWFRPPHHPDVTGPPGELPPLVVRCHSGPTSQSRLRLDPAAASLTTRGFGVVDVDYAGSSGYGRAFRERLDGAWGVADVQDCLAVARALTAQGLADPRRIVLWGTSAGGFTSLSALAADPALAGAVGVFAITDLAAFARSTHRFQSGQVGRLAGPPPRSPGDLAARIAAPVLLVHGDRDPVVPLAQARELADALRERGIPAELLTLPGAGHGFARPEDATAVARAELTFYARVLGLAPA